MAEQDVKALLLQINANTELLRSNLSAAERAVGEFQNKTQSHLDKTDKRFETLGHSIESLEKPLEHLKRIGETAFAFLLGESLIHKGKEALEFAGNIGFMSQQIGVSTKFLQEFRYAASQSGASIEVSDTALRKFARTVGEAANGNTGVIKLFNNLGVSVLDASGKVRSVENVYKDFSTAVSKIDNPAQRTADVLRTMGRDAGALIPVVKQGAEGFNALAAAAGQLGVVLSPELIEHSEEVNHKLAALKLIVDAQMASAVAQNATAIESIASALVHAGGAVSQFLAQHPERALGILGALAGLRAGGPVGGLVGGGAGFIVGDRLRLAEEKDSNDIPFRRSELGQARERFYRARNDPGNVRAFDLRDPKLLSGEFIAARSALQEQTSLTYRAINAAKLRPVPDGLGSDGEGDSNPDTSHKKKGRKGPSEETLAKRAEAARKKLIEADIQFDGDQKRLRGELLDSLRQGTANDKARDVLEKEKINAEADEATKVRAEKVQKGDLTAARANELNALQEQVRAAKLENVDRAAQSRLIHQQYEIAAHELTNKIELLNISDQLATTAKARREIELKLLSYVQEEARRALKRIIDDPKSTPQAVSLARSDLAARPAIEAAQRTQVIAGTRGPLETFFHDLNSKDINEQLQQVKVNGLQSLESGLLGVVTGTKSVATAFKEMAASIIADLARIAIEKFIIKAIGGPLFGFADGGLVQSFADGGQISGPGTGRSDSILARVSTGEFLVNAEATARNLTLLNAINDNSIPRFATGGLVSPQAIVAPRVAVGGANGGGATVLQFDLRGAVMTQDLLNQMNVIAARSGQAAAMAGADLAGARSSVFASRRLA